jgi:hypothetical protein
VQTSFEDGGLRRDIICNALHLIVVGTDAVRLRVVPKNAYSRLPKQRENLNGAAPRAIAKVTPSGFQLGRPLRLVEVFHRLAGGAGSGALPGWPTRGEAGE